MGARQQGVQVRAAAARAVDAVASAGRSLDAALADAGEALRATDQPLLRLLAYGAVRHYWQLQSWIDVLLERPLRKNDSVVNALIAVGLYQLTDTRVPDHAAVSATVEAARLLGRPKLAGLVNACLRRFQREGLVALEPQTATVRYNHPRWLIDAIENDWPGDWAAILKANNARAPMWLRVNTARGSVAEFTERLAAEGIEAERMAGLDQAVRLANARSTASLPGFADGYVSVQDGAAQIAAPWLLDGVRGRVLDACAAPGGKSAHLVEVGGDSVAVTCVDVDESRLADVRSNLERLGHDATLVVGDASKPDEWWDGALFDAILVDAPCSATGVIRRHPDIKLLRRADDIRRFRALQLSILEALWPLLATGGRLLYVTCSILAAENDEVVDAFLSAERSARENDVLPNNNISDVMRPKARGYQVLPGTGRLDGFYYACLERIS